MRSTLAASTSTDDLVDLDVIWRVRLVLGLGDAARTSAPRSVGRPLRRDDAALQPVQVQQVREQPFELARVRRDPPEQVERVLVGHLAARTARG